MKHASLFLITILLAGLPLAGSETQSRAQKRKPIDPALAELVDKVDKRTEEIESLRASFLQRREIALMKEPVEQKGTFSIRRPDGMRFDFVEEEDLLIVINNDDMAYVSHQAKKGGKIPIRKRQGRFVQKLLSDKLGSLVKYFDIEILVAEAGHHLKLLPAKRRLAKRFEEIQVWIDETYMIHRIRVLMNDGDVYELFLSEIELNVAMPEGFFHLDIPEDYQRGERLDFIIGEQL